MNQSTINDNLMDIKTEITINDNFKSQSLQGETNGGILNKLEQQEKNNKYDDYMEAVYFHKYENEISQTYGIKTIQNERIHEPIEKIRKNNAFHLSNYAFLNAEQKMDSDIESTRESYFSEELYPFSFRLNHLNDKKHYNEMQTMDDRLKLNFAHCGESEIESIHKICKDFPYQFYVEGDNLGNTTVIKHTIKIIPGSKIVNTKQYRIPHTHREILLSIVKDFEKQGIIEKCQSNYNSPAILVPKRDDDNGKTDYRFVVDYRKLNEICQISNFPIPFIDDILDGLGGCKYFTTLDIKGAFHHTHIDWRD